MIGLLQRVSGAQITVNSAVIAEIRRGLLVLVGVEAGDGTAQADRLLERLLGCRVFPDDAGKMNLSLRDVDADLMLVPQVTLAADTRKGARPDFSPAAAPGDGEALFAYLVERARAARPHVATGRFGAHMMVSLTNDGPVTLWLRARPAGSAAREGRIPEDFP